VNFDIVAVVVDQGHPGFDSSLLERYFEKIKVPFRIVFQDTYTVVKRVIPDGATTCGLCSRLRRGILYRVAGEEGATKIALGHHADDIMETFFMNLFFGGVLKAMPPRLSSDKDRHVVIRPLAYCRERDIADYAARREFPIIPCNLCGATGGGARASTKKMLNKWESQHPGRVQNIFRALQNVTPSHLLDGRLFDFIGAGNEADAVPLPPLQGEIIHVFS
jgi:tRNA 2-thiocytidine biosynthesis protein TtcA